METIAIMLDRITVDPAIFQLRPDYVVSLVEVEGLVSGPSDDWSREQLSTSARRAVDSGGADQPHILAWQEALRAFGVKPRRARSSVDALLRRVDSGLPAINRVVDVYNAVSVEYAIPIGGEDAGQYVGDARLTVATGEEPFDTVVDGAVENDPPEAGEVVWCDDKGVTCRRWNWRQCLRTRITEQSTHGYFLLERLEPLPIAVLDAATADLIDRLRAFSPDLVVLRQRTLSGLAQSRV